MKVLVIGQGGREHAICWKLKTSPLVEELYCAPGNPGTATVGDNVAIAVDDLDALVDFARSHEIDLTVVGPEYPLTLGIVDRFQSAGLRIFGPTQQAAALEGSKSFAKHIMDSAGVPTAGHQLCEDRAALVEYLEKKGAPIVLKADGLAAGKGVFVCLEQEDVEQAVKRLYDDMNVSKVVAEDYLEGDEVSFIVATNGRAVVPLAASHDYKRIRDNDEGPNSGGMGAVSPTPRLSSEQEMWVMDNVMVPVIAEMEKQGKPFAGFLYGGLIIDSSKNINVLEFNVRLGDPEAQAILRRLDSDLAALLFRLADPGQVLEMPEQEWSARAAVCVVMASAGYPETSSKGDEISGIEAANSQEQVIVFHAGTGLDQDQRLLTAGGRVLNVTGMGDDIAAARESAYKGIGQIEFNGKQFRSDIAS